MCKQTTASNEAKLLQRIAKNVHRKEQERAFEAGVAVTVVRGRKLIEINSDGEERVLQTLSTDSTITVACPADLKLQ